ncbi:Hsp20/alpha crystallin family protein [Chungangia koreensis]|uniref:Hsp20/alpha crystallin family protein n=1 Tax=Chungangia koreensis TaxID=752657 RepID=A0ABV8X576_9LACT
MMSIVPYDPFKRFASILREFEDFFSSVPVAFENLASQQHVKVTMDETDHQLTAKCHIPGIDKMEDITIEVNHNMMTITGSNNQSTEIIRQDSYQKQWFLGRFQRSIHLPCAVKSEGIMAVHEGETLTVIMPKEKRKLID